ncbi:MAG TPA: tryptophan synthase subunit alpha [Bacteroidota bacterium]|nr:tryptophan synthase subunit alpha [Bacteroidota bacterium]
MQNRIDATFARRRSEGGKTLAVFLTAGFPSPGLSGPLLEAIAAGGADILEIGIPFSDPIADGPTIQESSEISLRQGTTLEKIFTLAEDFRSHSEIPLVLMGYANPIYSYGCDRFLLRCVETGCDGIIIPDLTLEEGKSFRDRSADAGIASILLTSPTTPASRCRQIDEASRGFLYCVSVTGVTGGGKNLPQDILGYISGVKSLIRRNPLMVGFGIASPDDARLISGVSDGVIIGSSLIRTIRDHSGPELMPAVSGFIRSMRDAIDRTS